MSYENKFGKILRKTVLIIQTLLLITCVQLPIKPRMIEHKRIKGDVVAFSTVDIYPILIDKNNVIICTDYTATEIKNKIELPGTITKYVFYENWSKEYLSLIYVTYTIGNEYHLTCIDCFKISQDSNIVFDIIINDQQLSNVCTSQKSDILAVTQSIDKKEFYLYDLKGYQYSSFSSKNSMLLSSYRTIKEDKLYGFDGQCLSLFSIIDNNISVTISKDTKELSNINNLEICYKRLSYPYLNYTDKYITINNGKTIYLIDCSNFNIIAKFPNDQYSISFFNRLFFNNKGLYRIKYENQCFDIEQVLKGDFDIVCYFDQSSIILRNKVNNLYYHYTRIIRYPDIDKTLINVYDFSLIKDINIIFLLGSNNVIYTNSKTYTFLLE